MSMDGDDLRIRAALQDLDDSGRGLGDFADNAVVDAKRVRQALEEAGIGAEKIEENIGKLKQSGAIVIDIEADDTETTLENLHSLGVAVQDSDGWNQGLPDHKHTF